jgi:hypothetical protein
MPEEFNHKDNLTKSTLEVVKAQSRIKEQESKERMQSSKERMMKSKAQAQIKANRLKQYNQRRKIVQNVGKQVIRQLTPQRLSPAQISMIRKAQAARFRQVQAQRMAVQEQGREDNYFERQLAQEQFRRDEDERRRRFMEVPDDMEERREAMKRLEFQRKLDFERRNNILRASKGMLKIKLNMLRIDDTCNLARTPPIWRQDNPDNNVFRDTGRPTIMDTPNAFAVTPESQRWNILNAQKLNFGNVDTRKKKVRYVYNPDDEVF